MINYEKRVLDNGLTLLLNKDTTSKMVAVNIIYNVGAKDEDPEKTGFAHLFEHLMFGGSSNVPEFDVPIQLASGENNAFTNNDYTDYYIVLPKENIETALWVESDRMRELIINQATLDLQKRVVTEEFNQRYLNKPYGDVWALIRDMAYKIHPYKWLTIGLNPDHIANATIEDVKAFYDNHYIPSNAILSISGDLTMDEAYSLVYKWFGDIEGGDKPIRNLPEEPIQNEARRCEVERDVPIGAIYIAFHMGDRMSKDFVVCDTISDILSNGTSSRLQQNLVRRDRLFTSVDAYLTGEVDKGLFTMTGYPAPGVDFADAEQALWKEIEAMKDVNNVSDYELQKVKNKFEVNTIFGELNVMNKAMNMGYYEMIGDIDYMNNEIERYKSVTREDIAHTAQKLFTPQNSSTLIYKAKNPALDLEIELDSDSDE